MVIDSTTLFSSNNVNMFEGSYSTFSIGLNFFCIKFWVQVLLKYNKIYFFRLILFHRLKSLKTNFIPDNTISWTQNKAILKLFFLIFDSAFLNRLLLLNIKTIFQFHHSISDQILNFFHFYRNVLPSFNNHLFLPRFERD